MAASASHGGADRSLATSTPRHLGLARLVERAQVLRSSIMGLLGPPLTSQIQVSHKSHLAMHSFNQHSVCRVSLEVLLMTQWRSQGLLSSFSF